MYAVTHASVKEKQDTYSNSQFLHRLTRNTNLPYNYIQKLVRATLEEKFYTLQQVADMLQMHIETIRELVRNKELGAYKINKRDYRVSKADLDEYLRKRRTKDDDPQ